MGSSGINASTWGKQRGKSSVKVINF